LFIDVKFRNEKQQHSRCDKDVREIENWEIPKRQEVRH